MKSLRVAALLLFFAAAPGVGQGGEPGAAAAASNTKTRNVLLVTCDGVRWQDVFGGADPALLNEKDGGVPKESTVIKEFGGATADERRKALLPFVWNVIAKQGQLFGNLSAGSESKVLNGLNFSYPGYNEIFTGMADRRIDSNDKFANPNVSVLEWLNGQDAFRDRVAAFGTWDLYPYMLNGPRSRLHIVAGWDPIPGEGLSSEEKLINRLLVDTTRPWEDNCYDSFTFHAACEYIKRRKPRVIYLGFGETDEFAHDGRYDQYLRSANRFDDYLKRLWELVQSLPEYRGTTSLIVTTDHGRGDAPVEWKSHGEEIKGSERIWIAVLGPDTPALGERSRIELTTQSQIAATVAALLGLDYCDFAPKAGRPLASALPARSAGE